MKKFTFALISLLALTFTTKAQQYVSTEPANKNVVIEDFTGRGCGYCPIAHRVTHEIMINNPGRVWTVAIHSQGSLSPTAYPNLNTTISNTLSAAFPHNGIPAGVFNRNTSTAMGINESGSTWVNSVNQQLNQAAVCNVAGVARINPDTREATITVEVYYTGNSTVDNNYLTVLMIQDSILGTQSDYGNYNPGGWLGSQYVHMHVFRDMITPTWGEQVSPTTQGTLITKEYTYNVPENIGNPNGVDVKLEHIAFIAFVTEQYQSTPTRPILNACQLEKSLVTNEPIYPSISNVEQIVQASCSLDKLFKFNITNIGLETLTSLKFVAEIAGSTHEFEWNGEIHSGETAKNEFTMEVPYGTHEGTITITEANGQTYEASRTFQADSQEWGESEFDSDVTTLKVYIIQDQFGEQTTWDIINSSGEIIAEGGPYSHLVGIGSTQVNMLTIEDVPTDECYLFRIYDSSNNGICCLSGEGHYYIKDAYGNKIVEGAGDFGSKAVNMFSLKKKPDVVNDILVSDINIYPNPANNKIYVDGEGAVIVEVYNSLGQIVANVEGTDNTSVDVTSLDSGVYVVRVINSEGNVNTKKVTIAR